MRQGYPFYYFPSMIQLQFPRPSILLYMCSGNTAARASNSHSLVIFLLDVLLHHHIMNCIRLGSLYYLQAPPQTHAPSSHTPHSHIHQTTRHMSASGPVFSVKMENVTARKVLTGRIYQVKLKQYRPTSRVHSKPVFRQYDGLYRLVRSPWPK